MSPEPSTVSSSDDLWGSSTTIDTTASSSDDLWGSDGGQGSDNLWGPAPTPTPDSTSQIVQCLAKIEAAEKYDEFAEVMRTNCDVHFPQDPTSALQVDRVSPLLVQLEKQHKQCHTELHKRCKEANKDGIAAGLSELSNFQKRAHAGTSTGHDDSKFEVSIQGKGGGGNRCPDTDNAGTPSRSSNTLAVCLQYPYQSGCYTNLFRDGCRVHANEGSSQSRCEAVCNRHSEAHFRAACRNGCNFMTCQSDWAKRAGCGLQLPVQWHNGEVDRLFTSYHGEWQFIGQALADRTIGQSMSSELSTSTTTSSQFTFGLEVGAEAEFFGVGMSTTASTEWSASSEETIARVRAGGTEQSCGSLACTGNLYQWALVGTTVNGRRESMLQCSFVCVHSDSWMAPQCPSRFCASATGDESNTVDNCQCCNSHCWAPNSQQARDRVCPRLAVNLNRQCPSDHTFNPTRRLNVWWDDVWGLSSSKSKSNPAVGGKAHMWTRLINGAICVGCD